MVWFGVMSERGTLGRIRTNFTRDTWYFQFRILVSLRERGTLGRIRLKSHVTTCGQVLLVSFNKS